MKDWEYADLQQHYKELTNGHVYPFQHDELCDKIVEIRAKKIKDFKEKTEIAIFDISDHFNLEIIDELRDKIIEKIWEV